MKKTALVISAILVCTLCFGCSDNKSSASSSTARTSTAAASSTQAAPGSSAAPSSQAASSSAPSQSSRALSSSSSEDNKVGTLEEVKNPEVTVTEAKSSDTSKDYIIYEPANSADAIAHVIFSVKNPVKNFRIVKLSAKNVFDDGRIEFLYDKVFETDTLTPEKPILAGVNFGETVPLIGYMYTDASGKDRLFPMGLSGMDGSILVWEYK